MSLGESKVAKLYAKLEGDRRIYLDRARAAAELTIPTLYPPEGAAKHTDYPTPYQSVGARGVNNLASKLLLTLLPTNSSFFRMNIDDFDMQELGESERGKVEEGLARIERSAAAEVDSRALRVPTFEAMKQLLVSGNTLLYYPKKGRMRVFNLNKYVVQRSADGDLIRIIVQETVLLDTLPEDIRTSIIEDNDIPINDAGEVTDPKASELKLYTIIQRDGAKRYKSHQEVEGRILKGSEGGWPESRLPWLALRFNAIDGEDYGRSYVEEYYGDLHSLNELARAIVQGSVAAAKVLFLVNPNGTTTQKDLADSPNGAIVSGNATDVSTLQLEKFNDFRIAQETGNGIEERLSFAFLLNSAVQRNAERVTAEEIRYVANELETALGGVYSTLSQEFQLPLVNILLKHLEDANKMPKLPEGVVKPKIVTGLGALGRTQDLEKLRAFAGLARELADPSIASEINVGDALSRAAAALDMDTQGLVKTADQKAQEQQAAQQEVADQQNAELMGKAVAPATAAMGKVMNEA